MTDETQAPEAVQEDLPTNGWRIVEQAFSKADAGAVRPQAFEVEDEFKEHYGGADGDVVIIQPPYDLKLLERLSQTNNTLPACIEAMISNIDGTGYTFAKKGKHDNENEDTTVDILEETFSNLGIDESFITLRKKLRRDIEQVGNGYLEIIRNVKGDIIFVRHVDAKMVRLVRLDDPVTVTKSVTRGGKTFEH